MTKDVRNRLVALSEEMRTKAAETNDKELLGYARRLCYIANQAYESSVKAALGPLDYHET